MRWRIVALVTSPISQPDLGRNLDARWLDARCTPHRYKRRPRPRSERVQAKLDLGGGGGGGGGAKEGSASELRCVVCCRVGFSGILGDGRVRSAADSLFDSGVARLASRRLERAASASGAAPGRPRRVEPQSGESSSSSSGCISLASAAVICHFPHLLISSSYPRPQPYPLHLDSSLPVARSLVHRRRWLARP
ncbi:hypothetical protein L1887_48384 [Cichorium endivia]|nr:hypothetical protein L1887_48384 [Cichorium endivia]